MSPWRKYLTKPFELVTAQLCRASCLLTFIKYKYSVLNTSTLWIAVTYLTISGLTHARGEAAASVGWQRSATGHPPAPVARTPPYPGAFLPSAKPSVRLTRRSLPVSIISERTIQPIS